MTDKFFKYQQAIDYIEGISKIPSGNIQHSPEALKRFTHLLRLLGNPQRGFKYIHIGGTSGKGSVASMVHSVLVQAGHKTGLYLSPHVTTSIERIGVDNLLISPQELVALIEEIKPVIDLAYQTSPYGRPSYFEILTALAFLYFKQKKCEYVVLEVGCGGRWDPTNVIPSPKVAIINLVDYDHVHFLGHTLSLIAKVKSGIIKPGTTFFTTSKNKKKVLEIFRRVCKKQGVDFNLIKPQGPIFPLKLLGPHQQRNAELAAAACRHLKIPEDQIRLGLSKLKMPCRFEIVARQPLIILDGAHNPSKMQMTCETLKSLTYNKLYLIIALAQNKRLSDVFKNLLPLADYIIVTTCWSDNRRFYSPLEIMKGIKSRKPKELFLDSQMALERAQSLAGRNDLILVTGSFYLAGKLRKNWRPERKILKERKI
jgi:dihydrofolate synthase/folylpolyglutamate synthase